MKVISLYEDTPKQFLNPTPTPKKAHLGPKKAKNGPKIKSKSKGRIEGTIKNKSCSNTWVDSKQFLNPTLTSKMTPKSSQTQMTELKET